MHAPVCQCFLNCGDSTGSVEVEPTAVAWLLCLQPSGPLETNSHQAAGQRLLVAERPLGSQMNCASQASRGH